PALLREPGHRALERVRMTVGRGGKEDADALAIRGRGHVGLHRAEAPSGRDLDQDAIAPALGKKRLARPDSLHRLTRIDRTICADIIHDNADDTRRFR